jgi:hypothetical protein
MTASAPSDLTRSTLPVDAVTRMRALSQRLDELHRRRRHAAAAMQQDGLAVGEPRVKEQIHVGRQIRLADAGGLLEAHVRRNSHDVPRVRECELRIGNSNGLFCNGGSTRNANCVNPPVDRNAESGLTAPGAQRFQRIATARRGLRPHWAQNRPPPATTCPEAANRALALIELRWS